MAPAGPWRLAWHAEPFERLEDAILGISVEYDGPPDFDSLLAVLEEVLAAKRLHPRA